MALLTSYLFAPQLNSLSECSGRQHIDNIRQYQATAFPNHSEIQGGSRERSQALECAVYRNGVKNHLPNFRQHPTENKPFLRSGEYRVGEASLKGNRDGKKIK